jgi:hypothetical protein
VVDRLISLNVSGAISGEALFSSAGGSFIIDVETSETSWQITFTWLSP